nr:hypothetical protein [Streptomyces sp. yr375]
MSEPQIDEFDETFVALFQHATPEAAARTAEKLGAEARLCVLRQKWYAPPEGLGDWVAAHGGAVEVQALYTAWGLSARQAELVVGRDDIPADLDNAWVEALGDGRTAVASAAVEQQWRATPAGRFRPPRAFGADTPLPEVEQRVRARLGSDERAWETAFDLLAGGFPGDLPTLLDSAVRYDSAVTDPCGDVDPGAHVSWLARIAGPGQRPCAEAGEEAGGQIARVPAPEPDRGYDDRRNGPIRPAAVRHRPLAHPLPLARPPRRTRTLRGGDEPALGRATHDEAGQAGVIRALGARANPRKPSSPGNSRLRHSTTWSPSLLGGLSPLPMLSRLLDPSEHDRPVSGQGIEVLDPVQLPFLVLDREDVAGLQGVVCLGAIDDDDKVDQRRHTVTLGKMRDEESGKSFVRLHIAPERDFLHRHFFSKVT